ncbi:asparagine synthetase B, partial [Paenibacillus sepulcri]|nr:asparagine synthetase B [Paenibacillus sepulcri]
GDFAFVIWDERRRSLFGARDFSGNRTLYLARSSELFAFSTIIEPLFTLPGLNKSMNEQWISEFLAIPVTTDAVDCFSTVYSHIQQLPPSHSLTVSGGRITFSRYCTLEPKERLNYKSDMEYEEAFREVFNAAVTSRIRTHRQVGAHLSGGLDSGSVASFAARALRKANKPLHSFSYYPLEDFVDFTPKSRIADERPLIMSTVSHVGNIKDNYLNFPGLSPFSEIDDWLETMEMPYKFFENSFWLKGIYERAYHENIGVMLNGQRGNWTISWGPALDYQVNLIRQFRWIRFYRELQQYSHSLGVKKSRVMSVVGKKAFPFYGRFTTQISDYQLPMLINPQFAKRTQVFEKLQTYGLNTWGSPLNSAYAIREDQFKQLYFWNINGTIGTKLSLKYLMWDRDPTNDLRVIRFCLSVPDDQFVQNGVDRALIRRATEGYLPDNVRLNH